VLVIGAGPAGLAAAHQLTKLGAEVGLCCRTLISTACFTVKFNICFLFFCQTEILSLRNNT